MDLRSVKTAKMRREMLEGELAISLSELGKNEVFPEKENTFCENLIGAVSLPLGVAGPIRVSGSHLDRDVYIPLATTEGALVASVNRGCKIIQNSGGAVVRSELVGVTRGPVFAVSGINSGLEFCRWLKLHQKEIADEAQKTSAHLKLLKIQSTMQGRYVYLRFSFDTDQAMGMNMATIATTKIAEYLEKKTNAKLVAVAGNYDTDKKPSWLNFINGRGRKVWAEAVISENVVKKYLHVGPKAVERVVFQKCWGGSILSGAMGYNAHFANIVAAFYAATGQDLAHVVEGSLGITSAEVLENGDLYFSVYLPDVLLGTVGGGTKLKMQTAARNITKVSSSEELAEVLGAAVLAGELSLIGSLAENSLAEAHEKLGRR